MFSVLHFRVVRACRDRLREGSISKLSLEVETAVSGFEISPRGSVVKENEKERWLKLTYRYMTEESDDEDSNSIILHKIEWRCDGEFKCPFKDMRCLLQLCIYTTPST